MGMPAKASQQQSNMRIMMVMMMMMMMMIFFVIMLIMVPGRTDVVEYLASSFVAYFNTWKVTNA